MYDAHFESQINGGVYCPHKNSDFGPKRLQNPGLSLKMSVSTFASQYSRVTHHLAQPIKGSPLDKTK